MSPEQTIKLEGRRTSAPTYGASAMILYEMLTGSPMFYAESMTAVLIMISTAPTVRLRSLRADAPPDLEQALLKCLERTASTAIRTSQRLPAPSPPSPRRAREARSIAFRESSAPRAASKKTIA